jgi:cytidylate kinase
MYRAVAWDCLEQGLDLADGAAVEAAARGLDLELSTSPDVERVLVRGPHGMTDVTAAIREPRISAAVSAVATNLGVRDELIRRQRAIIAAHGRRMVVEGRDITTVVARDAEVRILLTASEEARLRRRGAQLGGTQSAEQLHEQVVARDAKDSTVASFTQAADGVFTVDSSDLDFDQTIDTVLGVVHAAVSRPAGA